MDSSTDINFLPYFLAFAACALIISYIYEKKRTEALKLVAENLGLSFSKKARDQTKHKHQNFQLFSKGHTSRIKNEMWGNRDGMHISIFGYQYTVGHGKHSTTHHQTVVALDCKKLKFPTFELEPENTFHKIGQVFGYQDIDFEAAPEFSRKYLLRGDNEIKIRQLFTPNVIRFFESNKSLCIEAQNNTLIFYKPSKRCKPDEIEVFLAEGQRIRAAFNS